MNKIIGWTLIAAWILTWCSNNNESIKENNEEVKENITIVEDSISGELIEAIDKKDNNNYRIKWTRIHKKMELLETDNINEKTQDYKIAEAKESKTSHIDQTVKNFEEWIDDWDEMKNYLDNNDYLWNDIWSFIVKDVEWENYDEVKEYDSEEDRMYIKKVK